ncbi:DoxX family protein [bacterium]|nr:DoxX family protein [bacterium]
MSAPAATTTRYPGFMAAFFLVALRIAIGWHFMYEGMDKLHSFQTAKPFSAEAYLRFANGPLSDKFRAIVPDVDSTAFLDLTQRPAAWKNRLDAYSAHYSLTADQKALGDKAYEAALGKLDAWRKDRTNRESLDKYLSELKTNEALLHSSSAMSYERERAQAKRKDLDGDRRKLVTAVQAIEDEIYAGLDKSLTPDQKARGAVPAAWTQLDMVNHLTAWGLTLSGASMMLGLLAPLGALGGAYLLTMFYLAMPPFPGLPANPMAEGHYLIVNKNVVEFLACIALVFIPTSMWVGLDAVLFGPWLRARRARREAAQ